MVAIGHANSQGRAKQSQRGRQGKGMKQMQFTTPLLRHLFLCVNYQTPFPFNSRALSQILNTLPFNLRAERFFAFLFGKNLYTNIVLLILYNQSKQIFK